MGFSLVEQKKQIFKTLTRDDIEPGTIVLTDDGFALCVAPGRFAALVPGDLLRVRSSSFWAFPALNADGRSVSPAPGLDDAEFDAVSWENGVLTVRVI